MDHIPQFVSWGDKTIARPGSGVGAAVSSAERGSGADKDGWRKGLKMAGEGTHKGVSSVYEFRLGVSAKPNTHHFHKNLAV